MTRTLTESDCDYLRKQNKKNPSTNQKKLNEIKQIIKWVENGDMFAPSDKALSEFMCEEINNVLNKHY